MSPAEAQQTAERFAENVWVRLVARVAMIGGGIALPFAVWSFSWLVTTVTDLRDSKQAHQFKIERLEADVAKIGGVVDLLSQRGADQSTDIKTLTGVVAAQLQAIDSRLKSIEDRLPHRRGEIDGNPRFTVR